MKIRVVRNVALQRLEIWRGEGLFGWAMLRFSDDEWREWWRQILAFLPPEEVVELLVQMRPQPQPPG